MAENGKKATDDRPGKAQREGAIPSPRGTSEVRTNDPVIAAPLLGPPPERAVSFQTAGLSGPSDPYLFPGNGGVVQCDDKNATPTKNLHEQQPKQAPQQNEEEGVGKRKKTQTKQDDRGPAGNGRHDRHKMDRGRQHERGAQADADEGSDEEGDRGADPDRRRSRHQHGRAQKAKKKIKHVGRKMPRWPTLLIVCALSLVCGVGGAWGYSALFGASQSEEKSKDSGKGGKDSDKSGSDKSGGKSGESDSDQTAASKQLKENLEDLDDGITQLTVRLDRLTESIQESRLPIPEYYSGTSRIARMAPAGEESPPLLPNALPTQVNLLERKVQQMSDVPERLRALEELMLGIQEEIKALHPRATGP